MSSQSVGKNQELSIPRLPFVFFSIVFLFLTFFIIFADTGGVRHCGVYFQPYGAISCHRKSIKKYIERQRCQSTILLILCFLIDFGLGWKAGNFWIQLGGSVAKWCVFSLVDSRRFHSPTANDWSKGKSDDETCHDPCSSAGTAQPALLVVDEGMIITDRRPDWSDWITRASRCQPPSIPSSAKPTPPNQTPYPIRPDFLITPDHWHS